MKSFSTSSVNVPGTIESKGGRRALLHVSDPEEVQANAESPHACVPDTLGDEYQKHQQQQQQLASNLPVSESRYHSRSSMVRVGREKIERKHEDGVEMENLHDSARVPLEHQVTLVRDQVSDPIVSENDHALASYASGALEQTMRSRPRLSSPPPVIARETRTEPAIALGESNRARKQRERRRRQRAKKAARKALCKKIAALGREGHWREALAEAESARASGLDADVFVYGSCIGAAAHSGRWREALGLLRRMRAEGVHPNTAVYNAAIHACDRAHKWRLSLRLLREMRGCGDMFLSWAESGEEEDEGLLLGVRDDAEAVGRSGEHAAPSGVAHGVPDSSPRRRRRIAPGPRQPEPDIQTFNSVMSACARAGVWRLALEVMEAARERELVPTQVTYNTAISGCARAGEAEMALALLREMPGACLSPDAFSFNAAIAACAAQGLWQQALSLLGEMKSAEGVRPDAYSFSSTITACAKARRWAVALRLLELMRLEKMRPGRVVLNAAIDACAEAGQWERSLDLLREMQGGKGTEGAGDGDGDGDGDSSAVWPDRVSFNSAMKACGNAGKWEEALSLLGEMERASQGHRGARGDYPPRPPPPSPDEVSYSTAIAACGRAGELGHVVGLLDRMPGQGLTPGAAAFTTAMAACRKGGRPGQVTDLLARMRACGVEPDGVCYGEALWCCAEAGLCELARELAARWNERDSPGELATRRALSVACTLGPKEGSGTSVEASPCR